MFDQLLMNSEHYLPIIIQRSYLCVCGITAKHGNTRELITLRQISPGTETRIRKKYSAKMFDTDSYYLRCS